MPDKKRLVSQSSDNYCACIICEEAGFTPFDRKLDVLITTPFKTVNRYVCRKCAEALAEAIKTV
jgi:hypothetical protein